MTTSPDRLARMDAIHGAPEYDRDLPVARPRNCTCGSLAPRRSATVRSATGLTFPATCSADVA